MKGELCLTARKKQSFLHGAVILTAATIGVKLIGAMFKIPLTNLLGGVGMGDFTIAYDIFRPLNSLAVAGLPVAVSKLTSESVALGRYRDARRLLRLSTLVFLVTGLFGFAVMFFGARIFSGFLQSPDSYLSIAALAPAVFFCCMMSAYRGYYQGLKNMYPTAVSQIVEAAVKLLCGIALSLAFMKWAQASLLQPQSLLRTLYRSQAEDSVLVSQFGAAGAVLGVTLSTAAGTAFLFLRHHLCGDGLTRAELSASAPPEKLRVLLRRMVHIAVPVCLGSVAVHLTTLIDLASIMNRLKYAMGQDLAQLLRMYEGLIPQGYGAVEIAKYLYGSYSGIAINIFNLVPSLTTTLGVSILPAVASAWAVRDGARVKRNIEAVLRVTSLIAMPAGLGIIALSGPLTNLLYGAKPMEAAIAAGLLRSLGLPAIFVSLSTPINAVLQAIGKEAVPVKLMVAGGALKLAVNFILVGMPSVNIQGAPVGTALCYLFIVLQSLRILSRCTKIPLDYFRVFGKPFIAGLFCAVAAHTSYSLLSRFFGGTLCTLAGVAVGACFYAAVILLTKTVLRDDVLMLPKGEKIAKILEKHGLIG